MEESEGKGEGMEECFREEVVLQAWVYSDYSEDLFQTNECKQDHIAKKPWGLHLLETESILWDEICVSGP